ncbi:hypothetical protein ACK350_20775 [Aeromonas veronii]
MTKPCTLSFFSADSKLVDEQEIPLAIEVGKDDEKARLAPFHKFINQLVDAENLIVLAGSGTSLTFNQKEQDNIAPSMGDLWRICSDLDTSRFDKVLKAVKYSDVAEKWDDGRARSRTFLEQAECD